jgi:hypothetical protein
MHLALSKSFIQHSPVAISTNFNQLGANIVCNDYDNAAQNIVYYSLNTCLLKNIILQELKIEINKENFNDFAIIKLTQELIKTCKNLNINCQIKNSYINSFINIELIGVFKLITSNSFCKIAIMDNSLTNEQQELLQNILFNKLNKKPHDILWQDEKNIYTVKDVLLTNHVNYYSIFKNIATEFKIEKINNFNQSRHKLNIINFLQKNNYNSNIIEKFNNCLVAKIESNNKIINSQSAFDYVEL